YRTTAGAVARRPAHLLGALGVGRTAASAAGRSEAGAAAREAPVGRPCVGAPRHAAPERTGRAARRAPSAARPPRPRPVARAATHLRASGALPVKAGSRLV